MPQTDVVLFVQLDGSAPVLAWLDALPAKVQNKCLAFVHLLAEKGYELRRPISDYLRDDIYELRIGRQGINYRILYFFHEGRAVLSHGIIKEGSVPPKEINRAIQNKLLYMQDPIRHTFAG